MIDSRLYCCRMTIEVITWFGAYSTVGQTSRQLIRRLSSSRGRNRVHRLVAGLNMRELGICGYLRNLEECMVHQIFWRLCGGVRCIESTEEGGCSLEALRDTTSFFFLLLLSPLFLVGICIQILWKLFARENSEKQSLQTFIGDR